MAAPKKKMIVEKKTGEKYKSAAAMKKHEAKESPAKQKAEIKAFKKKGK